MEQWYKFEILYKKSNPLSTEKRNKVLIDYQSSYNTDRVKAQEQAIKFFECKHFGDELIQIRLLNGTMENNPGF